MAALAGLLAAPARVRMLEALLAGGSRSAIDLAAIADVQPSTASSHLAKLVGLGLVVCEKHGRHRFYRVAGGQVGDVVEAIGELVPGGAPRPRARPRNEMEAARTCYDHLAGQLGTAITDAMVARRHIRPRGKDFVLAKSGRVFLAGLGVDIEAAQAQRRLFARRCLDWTERRYHLGGALGAALARHCFEAGWLRRPDDDRVIRATPKGARAFADHFGLAGLAER
jgi:DNA-binding transcriptional ArsR family regulator